MVKIFLSEITNLSIYKMKLLYHFHNDVKLYFKRGHITNKEEISNIIITTDININYYIDKYKQDFENNKKKLILISIRDTILDYETTKSYDKYVLCYLEFLVRDSNIQNEKILCTLNISRYFRNFQHEAKPLKHRHYDIVFIGNLNYGETNVTKQRLEIVEKIKQIGEKHKLNFYSGSSIKINNYFDILKETKLFISPYGWGEWSLKDFECVLYGCQCIKPNIYYKCNPNFYENMEHYGDNIDNLENLVLNLLSDLDTQQIKVNKNRQLFLEYNPENDINILKSKIYSFF